MMDEDPTSYMRVCITYTYCVRACEYSGVSTDLTMAVCYASYAITHHLKAR
jgi:hypothetical protein